VLFHSGSQLHHIQHPDHFLPFIILPKTTNQYIFMLKMATAVFAETIGQLSTLSMTHA
jgi:hypothetical protein